MRWPNVPLWAKALVVVLLVLVVGVLWASFRGLDSLTALMLMQAERKFDRKIDVASAKLQLFPHPQLILTDLVVHDREPTRTLLRAKHVELSLRVFPLLKKKMAAKRLRIDEPRIELHRDETGRWNILPADGTTPAGAEIMPDSMSAMLLVQETTLRNGEITITDDYRPDGRRTLRLKAIEATVLAPPKSRHADLRLAGTIPSGSVPTSIALKGRVTSTDSFVRLGREEVGHQEPTFQFEGSGEVLNADIRQLAEFLGPRPVTDGLSGTGNVRGQVRIVPGVNGYDTVISDLTANIEQISLKGQGSLAGMMSSQPTFAFALSSSPVSVEDLLAHVPMPWLPADFQQQILERKLGGTVEVVNASLTGGSTPEPHVSVTGEFHVTEGRGLVGTRRIPAQHLSGTVHVESGRMKIAGISGEYGPMTINAGRATISYPETGPYLDLEIDGEMAAADLAALIGGTASSPDLAQTFAALQDVKGTTQLIYRLAGSLTNQNELAFVGAEVSPRHVEFVSPSLPDRVTDLSGRIVISPAGIEVPRLLARVGQSRVEFEGAILTGENPQFQNLKVLAQSEAAEVARWMSVALPPDTVFRGPIEATVSLNGPFAAPQFRGSCEFKQLGVTFVSGPEKPSGFPATVEFEGKLLSRKRLTLTRLDLSLPPFRLSGKGSVRLEPQFSIESSLASGPIVVTGPASLPILADLQSGILEVSLDVKGRSADWKTWQYNGWVAVTDGTYATKGMDFPLTNLYFRMKLFRNSADIKRLAFHVKDSDIRLSGTVKNWNRHPTIDVNIESYEMNLDLLVPKGERSPVRDVLELLAADTNVMATIAIDRGLYKSLVVTDLAGQVHARDGALYVDQLSGTASGGSLDGRLAVRLPKLKPAAVEASFTVKDLPFETLLVLTGDERRMMTGALSGTGTLRGNGEDPRGALRTLNGKLDFTVVKGRIQKGTILPKIIGMLNLPALLQGKVDLSRDGFPFEKILGSLSIKNGVVSENELVIDSPIMKISLAGTYDLPSDRLNTVAVVSPFGSYSQLLKSIPLFGRIFAGERKGLLTAVFEIKGSSAEPDVTYRPVESLTTGLGGLAQFAIDVLKNTLTLPIDLLSPNGEKPIESGKELSPAPPAPPAPEPPSPVVP